MTKEEKIIATAFTGKMFIDGSEMGSLYEYMEKKVGHGVIDLMLASKEFWEELHKACEQDFIDMVSKEQPSLPSNLDEAASKELQAYLPQGKGPDGICYFIAPQMLAMYKAGAELMAGQSQKIDGDLEKEAEAYWKAQGGGSHAQWDKFRAVVKHFTNWQKEHIIEGL